MDTEINSITHLALELIICALIIGAVGICYVLGYGMYYDKMRIDSQTSVTESLADFYYFDDRIVTGSDALELIMRQTRNYKYVFEIYAGDTIVNSVEISTKNEDTAPSGYSPSTWTYRDYWSEKHIRDLLQNFIQEKYTATLIYDSSNSYIQGVLFTSAG